ncbi:MAG TPA: hypothetical protein VFH43_01945 [Candidatus Kapabacteria bacterium]|nr:hypothetical protein [Candidatus Kapabacteria bacterium]
MKVLLSTILLLSCLMPLTSIAQEQSLDRAPERSQEGTQGPTEEEGKLREFGKEAERTSDENKQPETRSARDDDEDHTTGEIIGDILFSIFRDVVVPAVVDAAAEAAVEAHFDTNRVQEPEVVHSFAQYPYHEDGYGLYKIGGEKDFSLNLKGNLHYAGQGFLGGGARLRVSPIRYFSGEAHVNFLTERVNQRTDRMLLAAFFLNYNLVRENSWAMWLGIGDKVLRGAGASADGLAGNIGLEIYPVEPMSFHGSLSFGPYTEVFATGNFHSGRLTFFFGYQAFIAGSSTLGGMVAGSSFYL